MNKNLMRQRRRQKRTRIKIVGKSAYPRLSVYRSSKHIYAQLIDDLKHNTLASADDLTLSQKKIDKKSKAKQVGILIGKKIVELKIKQVVFDRGRYRYAGRIKELADGAREAGIII